MSARTWYCKNSIFRCSKELKNGSLIELMPDWKLPTFTLYAEVAKHDQQPMKIQRCVEALKQYFSQLAGGRAIQIVR